jgi:hypothetical protein
VPYYITKNHPECKSGWATVKSNYEIVGCHKTKQSAINQMVAVSRAEDMEPGGTHPRDKRTEAAADGLKEGDFVSWNSSGGTARGRVEHIMRNGTLGVPDSSFSINATEEDPAALVRIWREGANGWEETETLVGHRFSTLTKINPLNESKKVKEAAGEYKVPEGVQSAAKRALKWISEGKAGDGFTATGRRRASQLAAGGSVTRDTVARMRSYFARHTVDKKAEGFNAGEKGYPSPGRVAWDAWGGDAGQTWVNRLKLD